MARPRRRPRPAGRAGRAAERPRRGRHLVGRPRRNAARVGATPAPARRDDHRHGGLHERRARPTRAPAPKALARRPRRTVVASLAPASPATPYRPCAPGASRVLGRFARSACGAGEAPASTMTWVAASGATVSGTRALAGARAGCARDGCEVARRSGETPANRPGRHPTAGGTPARSAGRPPRGDWRVEPQSCCDFQARFACGIPRDERSRRRLRLSRQQKGRFAGTLRERRDSNPRPPA
jgi:hypothetical protein